MCIGTESLPHRLQGIILLSDVANVGATIAPPPGSPLPTADVCGLPFPFYVEAAARTYIFSAADEIEQAAWVSSIVLAKSGRAAEAGALGAMGETLWGGNAQLLPPLVGRELVDSTPGIPLLARPVPQR